MTEILGEIALFGAPQDGGGIELAYARRDHGSAQRVPGQPWEDDRVRLAGQHRIDIFQVNAPARQLGAVGRFRHIRFGAEEAGRLDHGPFERPVFERVQSVVMDENSDGTLHRQQVGRAFNGLAQFLPPRFRRPIVPSQPATAEQRSVSVLAKLAKAHGGSHPARILRSIPLGWMSFLPV